MRNWLPSVCLANRLRLLRLPQEGERLHRQKAAKSPGRKEFLHSFPSPLRGLSFKTSARLGLLLTKDFLDAKAPCNSHSRLLSGVPNTTSRIWVVIGRSAKSKTLASSKVIIDTQVDHKSSRLQQINEYAQFASRARLGHGSCPGGWGEVVLPLQYTSHHPLQII